LNKVINILCIFLVCFGLSRTLNAQIDTVYSYLDLKFLTNVQNNSVFLKNIEIGGWFYKDTSMSLPDGGRFLN